MQITLGDDVDVADLLQFLKSWTIRINDQRDYDVLRVNSDSLTVLMLNEEVRPIGAPFEVPFTDIDSMHIY